MTDRTVERSEDEAAIRALVTQLVEGWNSGDGAAFAAVYEEDADFVVFNGAHLKGRAQIASVHQQLFDTFLKGSKLPTGGAGGSIRFLTADVALLLSKGAMLLAGQTEPSPDRLSVQTFVAVKRSGTWRFASFQNTRVEPAPGPRE